MNFALVPSTSQSSSTAALKVPTVTKQKTMSSGHLILPPPPPPPPSISLSVAPSLLQRKRSRSLPKLLLHRELGREPSSSLITSAIGDMVMRLITPSPVILSISSPALSSDLDERVREETRREQDSSSIRDATVSLSSSSSSTTSTSSSTFHITTLSFNEDGTILLVGDSSGRLAIFETGSFFSLDIRIRNSLQPRSQISPMIYEKDVTLSPLHTVFCPGPVYAARWNPKRIGHCAVICYGKRDIYLYDMTSARKNPIRVIQRDSFEPIGLEATFSSGNTDVIFITMDEGTRCGLTKSITPATVILVTGDGLGRIYGYDTRLSPKSVPGTLPAKPSNGLLWTIDISEVFRGTRGSFSVKRLWIERTVKARVEKGESIPNNDEYTSTVSPLLLFVATIDGHVCCFDLRKLSSGSFGSSKPRPSLVSSWSALTTTTIDTSSTLYLESVLTETTALAPFSVALTFEGGVTSVYDLFTGKLINSVQPSICALDQSVVNEKSSIEKGRLSLLRPKQYPLDRSMQTLYNSLILLPQTRSIAPPPLPDMTDGKTSRDKQRYFRGTEGVRIDSRPSIDHDVLTFVQLCGRFKGQRMVIKSPGCVTSLTYHPLRWDLIVLGMLDGEVVVMRADRTS